MIKVTSLCVILSLLSSTLWPRVSCEPLDPEIVSHIVTTQTHLMRFVTFSSVPLEIVSALLKDELGIPEDPLSGRKHRPLKEIPASVRASSGCALQPTETLKTAAQFNGSAAGGCPPMIDKRAGPWLNRIQHTVQLSDHAPGAFLLIALILLFFFLKPRSSVPAPAPVLRIFRKVARLVTTSRVFNFLRTPVPATRLIQEGK